MNGLIVFCSQTTFFLTCLLLAVFPVCAQTLELAGQADLLGGLSFPTKNHPLTGTESRPLKNYGGGLRLMGALDLDIPLSFEVHYQLNVEGGDERHALHKRMASVFDSDTATAEASDVDNGRRFFRLQDTISQHAETQTNHRIDRFLMSWEGNGIRVVLGRQAVTWGQGLVFNPLDIINPFAPTDLLREYKTGEDMALVDWGLGQSHDVQLIYVPRRNPSKGDLRNSESSLGGRFHTILDDYEVSILAARHYSDTLIGVGMSGFMGESAFRLDGAWTLLEEDADKSGFLSLVANLDFSWQWWGKNFYGLLEYFHNGIGNTRPKHRELPPALIERLARGELFVSGKDYIATQIRMEMHPLVNIGVTTLQNLSDGSFGVLPSCTWEIYENWRLHASGFFYGGGKRTDLGGTANPNGAFDERPSGIALLLTTFF